MTDGWTRLTVHFPVAHRVVILDGRIVYASLISLDFLTKRLPPPAPRDTRKEAGTTLAPRM